MSIVKIRAALETALDAMVGFVPTFTIQKSTAGVVTRITSDTAHGLQTGVSVTISGHTGSTPDLNGTYFVVVLDSLNFTLTHKVTEAAIASTAGGVGGVCRANLTAWDNLSFKPVPGVPYQRVSVLFAEPDNVTMGDGFYREHGYVQVNLHYPTQYGTKDIATRVDLIKQTFKRGSSFNKDGIVVKIHKTPMVMTGLPIDESYVIPVRIPFQADIFE